MTWSIPPKTAWYAEDGVTWVLDARAGEIVVLSDAASLIWAALSGAPDAESLVAGLAEEHDLPADEIRDDVIAFANDLVARGLLQENDQ